MPDLYVCMCMREFDDYGMYSFHFDNCDVVQYDPIALINEGKEADILHPSDPLQMYMMQCSDCSPSMIQEMLEVTAKAVLHPSKDNQQLYDETFKRINDHLATHDHESCQI